MLPRWWWVWALSGLLIGGACGGLLAGLPRLAHAELAARLDAIAERTGLSVHIGALDVSLFGRIRMHDIRVEAPEGAGLSVSVGQVATRLEIESLLAGRRRLDEVRVDGLVVQLAAVPDDMRDALDELKRRADVMRAALHGGGTKRTRGGGGLEDLRVTVLDGQIRVGDRALVEHLSIKLTRPAGGLTIEAGGQIDGKATVSATGRLQDGAISGEVTIQPPIQLPGAPASVAGVTLATDGTIALRGLRVSPVERSGVRVSATCDSVVVRPRAGLDGLPRALGDIGEVELVAPIVEVELPVGRADLPGWAKRVWPKKSGCGQPCETAGGVPGLAPVLDGPSARLRPSPTLLLPSDSAWLTSLRVFSATPSKATVRGGKGAGKREVGAAGADSPALQLAVRITGGRVSVRGPGGEELGSLDDVTAAVSAERQATTAGRATARVEGLPELVVAWEIGLDGLAPRSAQVTVEGVPVGRMLREEAGLSAFSGKGTADVTGTWARGDRYPRGSVTLRELTIDDRRISPLPVVLDGLTATARAAMGEDGKTGSVTVDLVAAEGGHARIEVKGRKLDVKPIYDLVIDVPSQDCAKLVASVPRGMLPSVGDDLKLAGKLDGHIEINDLDPDRPAGLHLVTEGGWDDCKIVKLPRDVQKRLDLIGGRFKLEVDEGEGPIGVFVGPSVSGYLSLGAMSALLRAGPLLTEDGAHFVHKGFSRHAIEGALRLDLTKKRYVYGGSSISQQLVKNLFLHRDKTLARKLEEAVIVVAMERALGKDRILELYLNCIEYGTKLYGIGNAAQHYFGKAAADLNPLEIAFLMHLKTSPKEAFFLAKRGSLPQRWRDAVAYRLRNFVKKGYTTQEVYDASAPFDPIGQPEGTPLPPAPMP